MIVHVRYYAAAREAVAMASEEVDLPAGSTLQDLEARLSHRHPSLAGLTLRWAVGEEFAPSHAPLSEGSHVSVLPPVSGG